MRLLLSLMLVLCSFNSWSATSQENRQNKVLEIAILSGFDYTNSVDQLQVSYFLDQDNLIGLKAGKGGNGKEKQTDFALQYKHYAGNSFYLAGEIMYLNTLEDTDWILGDKYSKYTSLGAHIRIGNQWSWKNFTLGCDWIGVGQRFVVFTKEDPSYYDTTLTLLNVLIGFSF